MNTYPTPADITRKEVMGPHFTKYHLGGGKVLHHFTRAEDEHFHNHPWAFRTSILSGGYVETVAVPAEDGTLILHDVDRLPGMTHEVDQDTIHKITRLLGEECWTLVEPGRPSGITTGFYKVDAAGVWHRYWHQSDDQWDLIIPVLTIV